jgi:thiamine-phosphate pyrophosphorylase
LKRINQYGVYRIIDANINRSKEGLRVCEEISRFILNNHSLTLSLKRIRHKVSSLSDTLVAKRTLLNERCVNQDVGRKTKALEFKRDGVISILYANMQRIKESFRVLEEFSKLVNTKTALSFKELRYKVYHIEKNIFNKK